METQFEDWVRRVVAFDTNAYRNMAFNATPGEARARARSIVEAERKLGIQALAYPTVLWELIAHLATPEDPSYQIAKAAVVAAVEHTSMLLNGAKHPAIWVSPDLQLCRSLWQVTPDELVHTDDLLRAIAARVADDPSESGLDTFRQDLVAVARRVEESEKRFATSMQQHLMANMLDDARVRGSDASRKELLRTFVQYLDTPLAREAVGTAHVLRALSYTDIDQSKEEIQDKAKWVAEKFAVAVTLYIDIVRKITKSNWDLTTGKGPNYLWDLQVAFLIGEEHLIDRRPASIVTSDDDIAQAATSRGMGSLILSYRAYRTCLRQGSLTPCFGP